MDSLWALLTLIKVRAFLLSISLFLYSSFTYAAVVENILTLNPKAFSLGNAVTADYVGIDSLQYNPAALVNLQAGFSTEFKLLGAPLVQVVRRVSPTLTPLYPEFTLFFRGYTVRCDSAFKPFAGVGIPSVLSANPGRDPVSGGLDPSIPSLNYDLPGDVCFGPELSNPNGIFLNDPLDSPDSNLDRTLPIPLALPFYLPNIAYKPSEQSRLAFAAQIFSNAPIPTLDLKGSVNLIDQLGIQRFTFTPGFAFQVTDKLSVGAAFRVSKSAVQASLYLDGQNQLLGFVNAGVHDLCKTNETRRNEGAEFIYDQLLNCISLYQLHQDRVDSGKARDSGYWPFLPWDSLGDLSLQGETALVYGWNLGVQWKPMPWLTWGATYRSKENDVYDFGGHVYYSQGLVTVIKGINSVPVLGALSSNLLLDGSASDKLNGKLYVPWPSALSTGVSMQVLEKTKVNIEYRKYYYSAWKNWDISITNTEVNAISLLSLISPTNVGNTIALPVGGEDISYYAYGIEQQWNKRLAFRFGYEDRPFLNESGVGAVPVYGIRMVSTGAEYKLTHDKTIDASLTSMAVDGTKRTLNSIYDDTLAILTLRGAEFKQQQLDTNALIFAARYTHRF